MSAECTLFGLQENNMSTPHIPLAGKQRAYFWLGLSSTIILSALGLTLVWGVGKILWQFLDFLKTVNAQIAAQIIGTSGTVLAAVIAVVLGQVYSKRRDIREAQRVAKIDTYNAFVKQITDALMDGTPSQIDLKKFYKEFTAKLMLAGSEDVVNAINEWRKSSNTDLKQNFLALDKLLRALRCDLGHNNRRLEKGALVKLYLNPDAQKIAFQDG